MPTERVEIVVGADGAGASTLFSQIGQASQAASENVVRNVEGANRSFETWALAIIATESAMNLLSAATTAVVAPLQRTISLARDLQGATSPLNRELAEVADSFGRLQASIGSIILEGLEASGVLGELDALFDRLTAEILDADTALGRLAREGITVLVRGVQLGISSVSGLIRVFGTAQEAATDFFGSLRVGAAETAFASEASGGPAGLIGGVLGELGIGTALGEGGAVQLQQEFAQSSEFARGFADIFGGSEVVVSQFSDALTAMGAAAGDAAEEIQPAANAIAEMESRMAAANEAAVQRSADLNSVADDMLEVNRLLDAFLEGISGDVTQPDSPAGGESDLGGKKQVPNILLSTLGTLENMVEFGESFGEAFASGFNLAITSGKLKVPVGEDGPNAIFENFEQAATSSLARTTSSLGRFVGGARDQFENLGEAMKGTIANAADDIGSAFASAGAAAVLTGGPVGALLGIGFMFSTIGGLLSSGLGGGAGRSPSIQSPDILPTVRPESRGHTTNVFQLSAAVVLDSDGTRDEFRRQSEDRRRRGEFQRRGTVRSR